MADLITIDVDTGGAGDYSTLSAAESGEQKDLASADEYIVFECRSSDNSADTTAVTVDGWTTDSTRYIEVKQADSDRHLGYYDTDLYRIETSGGSISDLYLREDYCYVDGVQIKNSATTGTYTCGIRTDPTSGAATAEFYIKNCIIAGGDADNTGGLYFGILIQSDGIGYVYNNIVYDFTGSGSNIIGIAMSADNLYCYNNTVQNCEDGYNINGGSFIAKNCIAQDCTDGFDGSFDGDSDYNCSDISSDAPGSNSVTGEVTFSNEGSDDFRLGSGDTVARGEGVDLSGDSDLPITTDILGTTRSAWDIGAHEYADVSLSIDQEGYRWRNDDGSESAATWQANQDTNVTIAKETTTRLRVLINATGDADAETYQLEYKEVSDAAAEWRKVPVS